MDNMYWKLIIAFIVGLLIGVGSTWLYFDRNIEGTENNDTDNVAFSGDSFDGVVLDRNISSDPVSSEDNQIIVEEQFPGDMVNLESVSLSVSGWVAIYEDKEGSLGNVLGAQLFDPGEHAGTVILLRSTAENSLYYAIVHQDDGDREFSLESDPILLDTEGEMVGTQFQTPPHRN
jgi:hypothetical protein